MPYLTDIPPEEAMIDLLASILAATERQNVLLGDIAQHFHRENAEASGEVVQDISGYVLSRSSKGAHCIHVYGPQAYLKYRVGIIYEERFKDLPFQVDLDAPLFAGENAPSRQWAIDNGYMNECPEFSASFMPTGKETDKGDVIRRFDHVVAVAGGQTPRPTAPAPTPPARPAPAKQPPAPAPKQNGASQPPWSNEPPPDRTPTPTQRVPTQPVRPGKQPQQIDPEVEAMLEYLDRLASTAVPAKQQAALSIAASAKVQGKNANIDNAKKTLANAISVVEGMQRA